jgi:hypothetical protein
MLFPSFRVAMIDSRAHEILFNDSFYHGSFLGLDRYGNDRSRKQNDERNVYKINSRFFL